MIIHQHIDNDLVPFMSGGHIVFEYKKGLLSRIADRLGKSHFVFTNKDGKPRRCEFNAVDVASYLGLRPTDNVHGTFFYFWNKAKLHRVVAEIYVQGEMAHYAKKVAFQRRFQFKNNRIVALESSQSPVRHFIYNRSGALKREIFGDISLEYHYDNSKQLVQIDATSHSRPITKYKLDWLDNRLAAAYSSRDGAEWIPESFLVYERPPVCTVSDNVERFFFSKGQLVLRVHKLKGDISSHLQANCLEMLTSQPDLKRLPDFFCFASAPKYPRARILYKADRRILFDQHIFFNPNGSYNAVSNSVHATVHRMISPRLYQGDPLQLVLMKIRNAVHEELAL